VGVAREGSASQLTAMYNFCTLTSSSTWFRLISWKSFETRSIFFLLPNVSIFQESLTQTFGVDESADKRRQTAMDWEIFVM
jgi:hypothetical protein